MITRRLILPAALAALAGCPAAPAPDPLPEPARVVKFTANPTTVTRGGAVTLTWETSNAATVEVVDLTRGAIPGVADKASGEVQLAVTQPTVFVISAKNSRGARATSIASVNVEGVEAAAIVFTAYPPVITAGQPGLLVWNAPNARQLQIAQMGGQPIDLKGQTTSGSIEVNPTATTTTYVLTADGVTRSVEVVRGQGVTEFSSSKAQVQPGDMLTLSWKTQNASKVKISSPGRGVLREVTDAAEVAMGSLMDTLGPQLDGSAVNYVLEAEGRGPLETKVVTVYYGSAPEVLTATAPKYVKENLSFPITWTTVGADRVEVRNGQAIVYRTPNGALAVSGSVMIPAPATATDFTVAAISSPSQATATKTVSVTPVGDVSAPTLTAAPTTIATGGTPVTLTWTAPGALRVRILENGEMSVVAIEGAQAASGTATVYPNRTTTTYELRASNTLEPTQTARASVAVTTPATMNSADGGTTYQTQGAAQVVWTVGGASSTLEGFGTPAPRVTPNSTTFVDISTTGTRLDFPANANDALLSFTATDFETFFGNRRVEAPVWVSTNGLLLFTSAAQTNSRPTPQAIPSVTTANVPEDVVAPLWADLDVGSGGVFWALAGVAPDRELIVQWNNVRVRGQGGSSLTFQARVHQSGSVTFEYRTITSTAAFPVSVGYQGPPGLGFSWVTPIAVGADAGAPATGPTSRTRVEFAQAVTSPAIVSTLAAPGAGLVTIGSSALRLEFDQIVKPTDVFISEVMSRPNPAVPQGQWFEIANFSNATIDVGGWAVGNTDGGVQATLAAGSLIPARGFLVLARTADGDQNDGLPVGTVAIPALSMSTGAGNLRVSNPQGFINDLVFPAATQGISLTIDRGPFVNRLASSTTPFSSALCNSRPSQTYGNLSPSQRGSPGRGAEGACIGYSMSTIPVNFKDISATGSAIPLSSLDDSVGTLDVTSNPVTVFGGSSTTVRVSSNGWMVARAYSGSSTRTNKVSPDTGEPDVGGVIAPFWDDLRFLSARAGSALLAQRMNAGADMNEPRGHWIIQWNKVEHYNANDNMTFQVKLFDTGDIEYHYATMTSATSSNYATGSDATIWLEADGAAPARALVYSVNRPNIRSNMALRFTRVP